MGQHIGKYAGKAKKPYETEAEALEMCGPGENCYVCGVCGKYHVGHELRFMGSMRKQLDAALARRKQLP